MKRIMALIMVTAAGVAGCDTTETHANYGQPGPYDQGYAYNQPQAYPPGYYQAAPGYPQGQYVPPPPPAAYGREYRQGERHYDQPYQQVQQRGPMTQAERIALGDNLVACIDAYANSIKDDTGPELKGMRDVLAAMRVSAENWRKNARAGTGIEKMRVGAGDLQARFVDANRQYAALVKINKRYESDFFAKISQAVQGVMSSVQQ